LAAAVVDAQQSSGGCLWLCGGDAPWLRDELKRRGVSAQMDQQLQLQAMVDLIPVIKPAPGR